MCAVVPLAMFVGRGAAAGERSHGRCHSCKRCPCRCGAWHCTSWSLALLTVVVPLSRGPGTRVLDLPIVLAEMGIRFAQPAYVKRPFDWGTGWLTSPRLLACFSQRAFSSGAAALESIARTRSVRRPSPWWRCVVWYGYAFGRVWAYCYFRLHGAARTRSVRLRGLRYRPCRADFAFLAHRIWQCRMS